jgi:exosortase O
MLRWVPAAGGPTAPAGTAQQAAPRPAWLGPLLAVSAALMALAYSPRFDPQQAAAAAVSPAWQFPAQLALTGAPLSARELDWVRQGGADTADRYTFQWTDAAGRPAGGALMLLTSRTWRGQHRPERCFEVFGLTVQQSYAALLAPDFPARVLALTYGDSPAQIPAVYWLQSAGQTTDDFGQRIWADLGTPQQRWVLLTVTFDQPRDPLAPELSAFFAALHNTVERALSDGGEP